MMKENITGSFIGLTPQRYLFLPFRGVTLSAFSVPCFAAGSGVHLLECLIEFVYLLGRHARVFRYAGHVFGHVGVLGDVPVHGVEGSRDVGDRAPHDGSQSDPARAELCQNVIVGLGWVGCCCPSLIVYLPEFLSCVAQFGCEFLPFL